MLAEIESLLVIQDRDQRILKLNSDLKQIPVDKERAKARLANDLKSVAQAKQMVQENEMAIKSLELDIGTRKNTLERLRTQQYETKKNDEFTALENEIKRYTNEVDELETNELELMEKADELRATQKKKEDALALTQSMVDDEIADLAQRETQCKNQLNEVQEAKDKLSANIDTDLLTLYERLMKSKGGDAVVLAVNSQCKGCHTKVVASTMVALQSAKEITQCENCGRILYF